MSNGDLKITMLDNIMNKIEYIFSTHKNDIITVSYSGGKDSTLLLLLISKFLIRNKKRFKDTPVYFIYSDTGVEIPEVRDFPIKMLRKVKKFLLSHGINIHTKIVKPAPEDNFFIKMILNGYPMPHIRFRWCSRVLKTKPIDEFIKKLRKKYKKKKIVKIIGVRGEESLSRRAKRGVYETSFFEIKNKTTPIYAPIYSLTSKQVWDLLKTLSESLEIWNKEEYLALRSIYGENMEIRHGCWVCPLISLKNGDKALRGLEKALGKKYLLELEEKKKKLIEISSKKSNRIIDRKGKKRSLNKRGKIKIIKLIEEMRKSRELRKALYGLLEDKKARQLYEKIKKELLH